MAKPAKTEADGPGPEDSSTASSTSPSTASSDGSGADAASDCHPVDEKLPLKRLLPASLQHIAAMYAGVVAPPLIVGPACGLSMAGQTALIAASLLIAGCATLLQTLGIGKWVGNRLPFVNAASSAGIGPMLAIAQGAHPDHKIQTVLGAVMVAGVFCLAVGPFFGKLMRFFPHLVTGVVITLIGVSLMSVPVEWARGGDVKAPDFGAPSNLALAAFTLIVIVTMQRLFTGFFKQVALLAGMVVGTLAALPFGMLDASRFETAPVFSLPTPFQFGIPEFQPAAIVSMIIVMLVLMTESSAGMLAIGEICDRAADGDTINRGLRTDGLATFFGSMFGSCATSAFAQNVGVVSLTKVRSRYVVAAAGGVLVVLGLFPILGAVVSLVPFPVLGGAGIALFGTISVSGIRTLAKVDLGEGSNIVIVAVSLGMGLIPVVAKDFYADFPSWIQTILGTGVSAGALTAVVLNICFNHLGTRKRKAGAVLSSAPVASGTQTT
ncbi:nucleobase:cation symporter-2 family protein [Streptomyces sp. ODS28]|uniref:uracil-xanthine permease family protein n=1 Tax=Streptomyces sp. ODS28 TaxID=3136688 RepID=UPI0031ED6199